MTHPCTVNNYSSGRQPKSRSRLGGVESRSFGVTRFGFENISAILPALFTAMCGVSLYEAENSHPGLPVKQKVKTWPKRELESWNSLETGC